MSLINVCDRIQCVFNDKTNGCQFYDHAPMCHLRRGDDGDVRPEMADSMTSEYWLYAEAEPGWDELRRAHAESMASDRVQRRLRFEPEEKAAWEAQQG